MPQLVHAANAEAAEHADAQRLTVHIINPAAVGPGNAAGADLKTAIFLTECAETTNAPEDCIKGAKAAQASGITADGAAALVIQLDTNETNAPLTMSVTNEATLVQYDPNYRNYAPMTGSTTLTFQPNQFSQCSGQPCVLAIIQAPDILQVGPGGGHPDLTQPIKLTVQVGNNPPASAQVTLDPPPVMLVHGLWGSGSSLANVQTYLSGQAPFSGLPSFFIQPIQYVSDIPFDDPSIEAVVTSQISNFVSTFTANNIAVGRVDVIAHSMGGLVVRHYSGVSGYKGSQNRQLGAFHQIITLDTPEAGSKLANFLIVNAADPFSPNAGTFPMAVKNGGCPTATSVQECFADLMEPLAPIGQPLQSGAVYSLEDGSMNIKMLPLANIPNVQWSALAASVSQNFGLMFIPNILVFSLDELIKAVCPGASFCPNASSKIPTIGKILRDLVNDGIVTVNSQTNGCTSPCQSKTLSGLAHTAVMAPKSWIKYALSYNNVVNDSGVESAITCWLAGGSCPDAAGVTLAADTNAQHPFFDPTRIYPQVHRLSVSTPRDLTMGSSFKLRIRFPFEKVEDAGIRERDTHNNFVSFEHAKIERAPDGQALITIPAVLEGRVNFIINIGYGDGGWSADEFQAQVGLPRAPPKELWADFSLWNLHETAGVVGSLMGSDGILQPLVVFDSAPTTPIMLKDLATFRVIPGDGPPVVEMHPNGSFTPLRPGLARVEVNFAGFTAQADIRVMPN